MDDEVEGYYGDSSFLAKPLKIMFCPYLNRSRFGKGEMGSWMIKGAMMELPMRKVGMESSKLPIRPPILLGGKSIDEVGRIGGEGALRKL